MKDTTPTDYQSMSDRGMHSTEQGLWRTFCVILAGKTNGAHQKIINQLRCSGHTEVQPDENYDYCLVFCPITSRVGTDINEALTKMPKDKPAILVVMHHTFDPDLIIAESRRLVENPDVRLTVDCLFYNNKLLTCNRNDIAWYDIQKSLGCPQTSPIQRILECGSEFVRRHAWKIVAVGILCVVGAVIIGTVIPTVLNKEKP